MGDDFIPSSNGGPPGAGPDRLNSWKEIAAYLGKGVRTVQRWEAQLGLPVRRLGREGHEIVYALRSEIDAWMLEGDHARGAESTAAVEELREAADGPVPPSEAATPVLSAIPSPLPPPPRSSTPRWVFALIVLVGMGGLSMSLGRGIRGVDPGINPVGAVFESGVLRAWNSRGEDLWTIPLVSSPDVRLDTRRPVDTGFGARRIAVEDLDGDGLNEVLTITSAPTGSANKLFVFNADGSPRFTHVPGRPVTYGSEVYRGFDTNSLYFIHEIDGSRSLWLTAMNVPWFPSVLQQISSRGEVLSEYWGNGYLMNVRAATVSGRRYLLVGGYDNERRGASLAILDREHPSGSAPAENPSYRCMDCAAGEPAEFLVFPPSDILVEGTAGQGTAAVEDARIVGEDQLVVAVHHFGAQVPGVADPVNAGVNYTLSIRDLSLERLALLTGYLVLHKSFERAGRLDHAVGPAEEAELSRVVRWSNGKFVQLAESSQAPVFARSGGFPPARAGS